MFNFFTVDLSAFYLNIQKDNLYCNRPDDPQRRASQHAVFTLLTRNAAAHGPDPLLHLRGGLGLPPRLSAARSPSSTWSASRRSTKHCRGGVDNEHWEKIMALRDRLLKEIETARAQKRIGDSLEADIEVDAAGDDETLLRENSDLFKTILVIAALDVRAGEGRKDHRAQGRRPQVPALLELGRAAPVDRRPSRALPALRRRRQGDDPIASYQDKKLYPVHHAGASSSSTRPASGW